MNLAKAVPPVLMTVVTAGLVMLLKRRTGLYPAVATTAAVSAALYRGWLKLHGCGALRPFEFTPVRIESIEVLSGPSAMFRTKRFRLRLPAGAPTLCLDIGRGEHVKVDWGDGWRFRKPRSYSPLLNGTGGSAPAGDGTFDLVIKIYDDHEGASKWFDRKQVGDFLDVAAPYPSLPQLSVRNGGGRFVGIICFGVGITEAVAVAEAELRRADAGDDAAEEVVLLWANRVFDDAVLGDSVAALAQRYPQFRVRHVYSREEAHPDDLFHAGRLDSAVIGDALPFLARGPEDLAASRVLVVGNVPTKKQMWATLKRDFGVRKPQKLLDTGGAAGAARGLWALLAGAGPPPSQARL